MTSSTSRKDRSKILGVIARARAEKLLLDWVNLREDSASYLRLLKQYPEVFDEKALPITSRSLLSYRDSLRKAWDAPDSRHRDWYIFQLRAASGFDRALKETGEDGLRLLQQDDGRQLLKDCMAVPPLITPLEAALLCLQTRLGDRAKHCGNPDCPTPYFIAVKRWQKYCSPGCAGPSTREAKRRWWADNRAKERRNAI